MTLDRTLDLMMPDIERVSAVILEDAVSPPDGFTVTLNEGAALEVVKNNEVILRVNVDHIAATKGQKKAVTVRACVGHLTVN